MTGEVAIEVRGLTKRFGEVLAVDALDLDVPKGSAVGLLGPAGAGKSIVLRLLAGLARPNAGTVRIAGERLRFGDGVAARGHLALVPQDPGLPGWMTAREVLAFLADLSGVPDPDRPPRIEDVARRLKLTDALDRRVAELPAPVRGRLSIAQALVSDPAVVLLDEPFHWLDPEGRLEVRAQLQALQGRRTVLLASHRLADIEGLCDRVVVFDAGRVRYAGPTETFLASHAPPVYVIELTSPGGLALEGLIARLRMEPWAGEVGLVGTSLRVAVLDDVRAARELLPAVVATGVSVGGVRRARPALDAILAGLPQRARHEVAS